MQILDSEEITVSKLFVYPDFSKSVGQLDKNPSKNSSPSTKSQNQTRRRKGEGSGSISYRTVIRNGKEYQQAYSQILHLIREKSKPLVKVNAEKVRVAVQFTVNL